MRSLSEGLTSAQVEEGEKNESCDRVKTSFSDVDWKGPQ